MTDQSMAEAYRFPNGFDEQARSIYGWLLHYNLTPKWGDSDGTGDKVILLNPDDMSCLREMQKANPARFGDAPV